MSTSWYINAASSTQDGLTPATGYHTPNDLVTAHSGSFIAGDIMELVAGTEIDCSALASCILWNNMIVRSYGTNGTDRATNKPVVNLGSTCQIGFGTPTTIQNIVFRRDGGGGNMNTDLFNNSASFAGSVIEGCEFLGQNHTGGSMNSFNGNLDNFTLRNNIVANLPGYCIVPTSNTAANAIIANNVLYHTGSAAAVINMFSNPSGCTVVNNIAVGVGSGNGIIVSNVSSTTDYNIAYNFSLNFNAPWKGANDQEVDPLFTNPGSLDFTLQGGSPAKTSGIGPTANANVSTTSYSGVARSGATTDKGAYEYASAITPVADFTSDTTSGPITLSVNFTDTSTNTPTSWDWDFGDGSLHSTSQNPTHNYTVAGIYTVALTATNTAGSNTNTKTSYITASAVTPVADFTSDVTSGPEPLTVNFTDTSTNIPTSWSWNFGDSYTSTLQNPSHTYTAPGSFTVALMATNTAGSDTETKTNYIMVTPVDTETTRNLTGTLDIHDYRMIIVSATLNPDSSLATITYKGVADPATSSDIVGYDYSTTNGATWLPMTTSSSLTGLPFVADPGYTGTFVWQIKNDLGTRRYNNYIRVRLRSSGSSLDSDYAYFTIFIERIQTDLSASKKKNAFPADYAGIPGGDLKKNAPKS